jgi:hypothetical protein
MNGGKQQTLDLCVRWGAVLGLALSPFVSARWPHDEDERRSVHRPLSR